MSNTEIVLRFVGMMIFGAVFVLAGIFHWKFPSIHWYLRETEYGEIINTIAMIILGICIWGMAVEFLIQT